MKTLYNANCVITGNGSKIQNGSVVVEGNKITRLGPEKDVEVKNPDLVFDLQDHTILPGLIDSHVHLTLNGGKNPGVDMTNRSQTQIVLDTIKNCRKTIDSGVTTVRDLGSPYDIPMAIRDEVEFGTFRGPRIVAGGQAITATGGHGEVADGPWHLPSMGNCRKIGRAADGVPEVKKAVREQLQRGADCIKVIVSGGVADGTYGVLEYSSEELSAIVSEASRHGVDVASHAHSPEAIAASVNAGVCSVEHGTFIDNESINTLARSNVYLVSTLSIMHAISNHSEVPEQDRRLSKQAVEHHKQKVLDAHEAGVSLAMGTDAGGKALPHGRNPLELKMLVDAGLDPMDAINISTHQSASMIGLGHEIGVLEQGYAADLIAVKGDPVDSIDVLQDSDNIDLVVKSGEIMKNRL